MSVFKQYTHTLKSLSVNLSRKAFIPVIIFVLLLVLLLTFGLYTIKDRQQDIVSFDLQSTQSQFIEQLAHTKLSHQAQVRLSKRFSRALSDSVNQYAAQHRSVVLVKAAVIAGVKDITPDIQKQISKRMALANKPILQTHHHNLLGIS